MHSVKDVAGMDVVKKNMMTTQLPSGKQVALFPAAVKTDFLTECNQNMICAPRLGEHNRMIYKEIGLTDHEIDTLKDSEII